MHELEFAKVGLDVKCEVEIFVFLLPSAHQEISLTSQDKILLSQKAHKAEPCLVRPHIL